MMKLARAYAISVAFGIVGAIFGLWLVEQFASSGGWVFPAVVVFSAAFALACGYVAFKWSA